MYGNFLYCQGHQGNEGRKMNIIDEVMTATEAAQRWGLAAVTVRQACSGYVKSPPKFTKEETRRSGSTWLITRAGMCRVFGPEK